jgi:hypothetical protein
MTKRFMAFAASEYKHAKVAQGLAVELRLQCQLTYAQTSIHLFCPIIYIYLLLSTTIYGSNYHSIYRYTHLARLQCFPTP